MLELIRGGRSTNVTGKHEWCALKVYLLGNGSVQCLSWEGICFCCVTVLVRVCVRACVCVGVILWVPERTVLSWWSERLRGLITKFKIIQAEKNFLTLKMLFRRCAKCILVWYSWRDCLVPARAARTGTGFSGSRWARSRFYASGGCSCNSTIYINRIIVG